MMVMSDDQPEGLWARARVYLLSVLLVFVALFGAGVFAGAAVGVFDGGEVNWIGVAIAVVLSLAVLGGAVWGLMRLRPWAGSGEPVAPSARKTNRLALVSAGIGGLIGLAGTFTMVGSDDPTALLSNRPMPPSMVIAMLAIWLGVVPLLSWLWHRSTDEHDLASYRSGGLAALYLYAFLAPTWWLAWRGGLAPAPDTMIVYLAVMGVWGLGWFWRRYR